MKLPSPTERLADCVWLPRILAKARLNLSQRLPPDYESRFCHPSGIDGLFLTFFQLTREQILSACAQTDADVAKWFLSSSEREAKVADWNHVAVNLGRSGFPMADRLPLALASTYKHLAGGKFETVFEVLEADERDGHI